MTSKQEQQAYSRIFTLDEDLVEVNPNALQSLSLTYKLRERVREEVSRDQLYFCESSRPIEHFSDDQIERG